MRKSAVQASLIAEYTHEAVDPLTDDAGGDHNLTSNGGPTFVSAFDRQGFVLGDTVGDFHRAGGNDQVDAPANVYSGQSFTFTALVRRDSAVLNTGHQTILSTDRFRFQWRISRPGGVPDLGTSQLTLALNNGGGAGSGPGGSFPLDTWVFTAMRYDHTTHTVNGWMQDSSSSTLAGPQITLAGAANDLTDIASTWRIGNDGLSLIGGADPWDGWIDSARIYDAALTDQELNGVFNSFLIPEPSTAALMGLGVVLLAARRRFA